MASSDFLHLLTLATASFLLVFSTVAGSEPQTRCYESIISFGDSIADTGNLLGMSDPHHLPLFAHPPYGETFFHHPTGRHSDGRLIIDFIAEFLGLPLVPPYFGSRNRTFEKGVNFAVAGATALDAAFLEAEGVPCDYTNVSLGVQLSIFKEVLPSICGSSSGDCREFLGNSLILMGEIGGNDLNYALFTHKSINKAKEFVPLVINAISSAIVELVDMGGRAFLVPGNFPIGCFPVYLTIFQTANTEAYDSSTGCLSELNEFARYYNEQLQTELDRLGKIYYPDVNIIYADYYYTISRFYDEPSKYGFMNRPLSACCGTGGPYNFSAWRQCGDRVPYCDDPSEYVNWDGVHLTEAAYRWIAEGLLNGPYAHPPFNSSCFASEPPRGSSDDDDDDGKKMVETTYTKSVSPKVSDI